MRAGAIERVVETLWGSSRCLRNWNCELSFRWAEGEGEVGGMFSPELWESVGGF